MSVMTGAKRKQEGVRSIVIHPEIYIFESVDLSAWERRQHLHYVMRVFVGDSGGMGLC
ncbi:MAG: hypothetical protein KAJ16_06025 [Calditrichia bacterium]|nr:hypothetical protein [Calditrichia bacterium]